MAPWAIKVPRKVRLEFCSLCQLDCRDCFMRRRPNEAAEVGLGYLSFANFKRFIALNPEVEIMEVSNSGEIFLNPDLEKIIEYAHQKNITLTAYNGVNFNTVSESILESLVKYKFYGLTLSIDGSDQKSYVKYRKGGNFEQVLSNLRRLYEYKQRYQSYLPLVKWKYVIFPGNDSKETIVRAKHLAEQLGMEIQFDKDYTGFVPEDLEMIERETGLIYGVAPENFEKELTFARDDYFPCFALWHTPQINWDGRVFGCCINHQRSFSGNLFEMSLKDYLNAPEMMATRAMLMGGEERPDVFCKFCNLYRGMLERQDFIKEEELKKFAAAFAKP